MSWKSRARGGLKDLGLDVRRMSWHYERRRAALLASLQVTVLYDAGANAGQYGQLLRRSGYAGRLVSFEPIPEMFGRLSKVMASDPRWTGHNVALGSSNGETGFNVTADYLCSSPLQPTGALVRSLPGARTTQTITVPVRRLDDLLGESNDLPASAGAFLKIDVQGFEGALLDGAPRTLNSVVGLEIECSMSALYEGGTPLDATLSRLYGLGFEIAAVQEGAVDKTSLQLLDADFFMVRRRPVL